MRNLKSMYCGKNSDEIDHYKNFGHQKVFSIFIKKIYLFSSIFPQNFFNKRGFFLKNLRNLRPKIFEASKILRLLEMGRRRRRRWIFGQKSSKNEDLRSFVATLHHYLIHSFYDIIIFM